MKEERVLSSTTSIVLSDTVIVSDPCYSEPNAGQTTLTNVKPGTYVIFVDKEEGRCWALVAIHQDYVGNTKRWYNRGEVWVDSGQAGIFNAASYRNDSIVGDIGFGDGDISFFSKEPWSSMGSHKETGEQWYQAMCSRTLGEQQWGVYDDGVVSSSGWGDGSYPLKIQKDKGKIVGIMIDFGVTDVQAKFLQQFIKPETV